ncbi:MAG: hypothetical protein Q7S31_02760, partial [bacterium]|nr:hypothetical protein [bacterium]
KQEAERSKEGKIARTKAWLKSAGQRAISALIPSSEINLPFYALGGTAGFWATLAIAYASVHIEGAREVFINQPWLRSSLTSGAATVATYIALRGENTAPGFIEGKLAKMKPETRRRLESAAAGFTAGSLLATALVVFHVPEATGEALKSAGNIWDTFSSRASETVGGAASWISGFVHGDIPLFGPRLAERASRTVVEQFAKGLPGSLEVQAIGNMVVDQDLGYWNENLKELFPTFSDWPEAGQNNVSGKDGVIKAILAAWEQARTGHYYPADGFTVSKSVIEADTSHMGSEVWRVIEEVNNTENLNQYQTTVMADADKLIADLKNLP